MKPHRQAGGAFRPGRHMQFMDEPRHDPYERQLKPPEPTQCPVCHAVFHAGRWTWNPPRTATRETTCAACLRLRDHHPAGYLALGGTYLAAHRSDILALLRATADYACSEHPMQRIMAIEEGDGGMLTVTTTDIHLARALGEAVHAAHRGTLDFAYETDQPLLRVRWQRD